MISSKIVMIFLLLQIKKMYTTVWLSRKDQVYRTKRSDFFPKASKPGNTDLDVRAIAAFAVYTN